MREAYRLQKEALQSSLKVTARSAAVFFIYIGKELPVYGDVYEKMGIVLHRINEKILNQSKD